LPEKKKEKEKNYTAGKSGFVLYQESKKEKRKN